MPEAIIWYVTLFGTAILFYLIGVYAQKRKKPMWFWAGSEVNASQITDVKQYNKENGTMWKLYSLWFWAAGLAEIWSSVVALVILALSCTVGLALLTCTYKKISKKYSVQ